MTFGIRTLRSAIVMSLALTLLAAVPAHAGTTVAQWNMDELSGTTMVDSSGMGNDGTTSNVTFGAPGFTGAPGDYAYSFDGSSSNVVVPPSAELNPGSSDISITARVKTTFRAGTGSFDFDIIRKGGGYKIELYLKGGLSQARCVFKGSLGKVGFQAGPDLIDGAWHTIVCSKTSTTVSITVDGTTYARSGAVGSISNRQPVAVGFQTAGLDYYHGLLDDVSIVVG
jgi:hypothetical protein